MLCGTGRKVALILPRIRADEHGLDQKQEPRSATRERTPKVLVLFLDLIRVHPRKSAANKTLLN